MSPPESAERLGGFYSRDSVDEQTLSEAMAKEGNLIESPAWRPATRRATASALLGRARALRCFLSGVLLLDARTVERAGHRLVPLVAGVLVDLIFGALHEQHRSPGFRPRQRIVDGHFVLQRLGVHAREPLDQMQLLGGAASPDRRVGPEVGRIDDKRV